MRGRHSEIGGTQLSDPEYIRRETSLASRRSEELVETPLQKFQTNTKEKMQLTKQTNEAILPTEEWMKNHHNEDDHARRP